MKLAAAPISWGVSEVPGWGEQVSVARVLGDAAALGFRAIESGPPGFLPSDPSVLRGMLRRYGLTLVGGFVTAALHEPEHRDRELSRVRTQADWLAAGGAEVLVLAASIGESGYEARRPLDERGWRELLEGLERVRQIADPLGMTVALHPHVGTAIVRPEDVERVLAESGIGLCLDSGHLFIGGVDPAELVSRFPSKIRHVHLKDVERSLAERVRSGDTGYAAAVKSGLYRPLGSGDVGIDGVLDQLARSGFDGWYVLEQDVALDPDSAARGSFPWIAESLRYLSSRVA